MKINITLPPVKYSFKTQSINLGPEIKFIRPRDSNFTRSFCFSAASLSHSAVFLNALCLLLSPLSLLLKSW